MPLFKGSHHNVLLYESRDHITSLFTAILLKITPLIPNTELVPPVESPNGSGFKVKTPLLMFIGL